MEICESMKKHTCDVVVVIHELHRIQDVELLNRDVVTAGVVMEGTVMDVVLPTTRCVVCRPAEQSVIILD